MTVRHIPGGFAANPFETQREDDRTRFIKGQQDLPKIPLSDLTYHATNKKWLVDRDGVAYQFGHDAFLGPVGAVTTLIDGATAYALDDAGKPVLALKRISRDTVAEWDENTAERISGVEQAKAKQQATVDEYLGRKDRNYGLVTIPGTKFRSGINLPALREQLEQFGVQVTKGGAGRFLVSFPAGASPLRRSAEQLADIAARYAPLLLESKLTCDVARCSRSGDWVTGAGGVVCDKHSNR
jgi:hypothetical protein